MRVLQLDRIIDRFVSLPLKTSDDVAIRRARMVVFTSFLFVGITTFFSILHFVAGDSNIAGVLFVACALLCVSLTLYVRKSGQYRLLSHLHAFILLSLVSTLSYFEGGFEIGTFMWTTVVVIMGPHLVGIKGAIFWATTSALLLIFFYFFNGSSLAPTPTLTIGPEVVKRFDVIILLSLTVFMFLWSVNFERLVERSIREKKLAEDELRQAQRLESVGLLAGGIAHDFNNLLSVILTYTNLLYEGLDETDPRREEAFQIRTAGERATDIVKQLLQFSRKEMDQPEPLDLNQVLSDMKGLLERSLGEAISLNLALEEGLRNVFIDRRQIQQVLLNLTINARDAMPDGGRFDIRTANTELTDGISEQLDMKKGRFVQLLVVDTGLGMNEQTKSRIFEPFFTTKPTGKGTGLGLSTTYGIIKQARGSVTVDSTLGKGTQFSILLPVYDGEVAVASLAKKDAVEKSDKKYKILLVEDDDGVREATRRVLSKAGFQMLSVRDSDEALRICRSHTGEIDVLLTDVVMPGMSGSKLAELAPKFQPQIAVVLMSGYADDDVLRYGLAQGRFTFVQKPFKQEELIKAIHKSVLITRSTFPPKEKSLSTNTIQC
jgi:signal transduction histidine kinase/CheY-like chemotaxis protein